MTIMPARMHDARDAGDMRRTALLPNRQRVHVSPYPDAPLPRAARQRAHHSGPGEAAMHSQPEALEARGDELRGLALTEGQLRMPVQMVSPGNCLGQQL